MRYRCADASDAAALARRRWAFRLEGNETPIEPFEAFAIRYQRFFAYAIRDNAWSFWVAESGGTIVAHLAIHIVNSVPRPSRTHDRWGYLTDCYTDPAMRNCGIGSTLLATALRWAEQNDLELLIVSPSERSVSFYQRAGFQPHTDFWQLRLRDYDAQPRVDGGAA